MDKWPWFQWLVLAPLLFAVSFYCSACGGPVEAVEQSPSIIVFGDDFVTSGASQSTTEVQWIGHNNASTVTLLQAVPDIVSRQPVKVYIMVGAVDFIDERATVASTIFNYSQIIEQLTGQGINVTAVSVLYVARQVNTLNVNAEAINAQINNFNTQLETMCRARGCQYLDVNDTLSNDGFLEEGYALPGGVYLTGAAYATFNGLITRDVDGRK